MYVWAAHLSADDAHSIPDGDEDVQHLKMAKMRALIFSRGTAGGKNTQRSKNKNIGFF